MYGALGVLVLIGAIVIGVSASAVSDSDKSRSNIKAKEDREEKLARQSSVETIKAILPGLIRYADLLEGKIKVPVADHKRGGGFVRLIGSRPYARCQNPS
jgi:hypothetical protein